MRNDILAAVALLSLGLTPTPLTLLLSGRVTVPLTGVGPVPGPWRAGPAAPRATTARLWMAPPP